MIRVDLEGEKTKSPIDFQRRPLRPPVSLAKMLAGAIAFEISDIQERLGVDLPNKGIPQIGLPVKNTANLVNPRTWGAYSGRILSILQAKLG